MDISSSLVCRSLSNDRVFFLPLQPLMRHCCAPFVTAEPYIPRTNVFYFNTIVFAFCYNIRISQNNSVSFSI